MSNLVKGEAPNKEQILEVSEPTEATIATTTGATSTTTIATATKFKVENTAGLTSEAIIGSFRVSIQSLTADELRFIISGVDDSYVNALRRIMISEVPTLAIDRVVFYANTTSHVDEYIAHRMGLILISSQDVDHFPPHEECPSCCCISTSASVLVEPKATHQGGSSVITPSCSTCCLEYKLHVKNTHPKEPLIVTTRDLIPVGHTILPTDVEEYNQVIKRRNQDRAKISHVPVLSSSLSSSLSALPCVENLPNNNNNNNNDDDDDDATDAESLGAFSIILTLDPGQEIELRVFAKRGIGKQHIKWSPVEVAHYKPIPNIIVDSPTISSWFSVEEQEQIVTNCRAGVFAMKDDVLVVKNSLACTFCEECTKTVDRLLDSHVTMESSNDGASAKKASVSASSSSSSSSLSLSTITMEQPDLQHDQEIGKKRFMMNQQEEQDDQELSKRQKQQHDQGIDKKCTMTNQKKQQHNQGMGKKHIMINQQHPAIQVDVVKKEFLFTVEPTGVLPPEVIVMRSIAILKQKVYNVLKEMSTIVLKKEIIS
jgi:DNA-directed RNA polymerase alpha subunit